jgi:hypothetical protein
MAMMRTAMTTPMQSHNNQTAHESIVQARQIATTPREKELA